MKSLKGQLIAAIAMTLISVVTISSSTYAWFSTNNVVSATGMTVNATATGALVITSTEMPSKSKSATTVSLALDGDKSTSLAPATHDSTWNTYKTGLKVVSNASVVDPATGLASGDSELTFKDADGNSYVDFRVYIAAAGQTLSNQDLTVQIESINGAVTDTHQATSIDFYVNEVTGVNGSFTPGADNYKGTLNVLGMSNTVTLLDGKDIPQTVDNGTKKAWEVVMRVYFDGGLTKDEDHAYVYSNNIDTDSIALNVKFEAAENK